MAKRLISAFAAAVGIVGSIVGILLAPRTFWEGIWDRLYPIPLIVVLAVALVVSWVYFVIDKRRPSDADQRRLDTVFELLSRKAIDNVAAEGFVASWRDTLTWPVVLYVEEHAGHEEHFDNRAMEKRRQRLFQAADEFRWADAKHGFPDRYNRDFRNTGWSEGELEFDERKLGIAERRAKMIRDAAEELVAAHDDFVALAKRRGYALDALSTAPPIPPWKEGRPARASAE
jgi:hypothetical protein